MNKSIVITGLDIGSSKVSAVELEISAGGHCAIVAYDSQPSKGLYRGVFTDISEVSNSVAKVLKKLNDKTRVPIAEFIRQGIDLILEKYRYELPGEQLTLLDTKKS